MEHWLSRLEYPYIRYFISLYDIFQRIEKLKRHRLTWKDRNTVIVDYKNTKELMRITDYFTEPCRVRCRFKNQQSTPLEYYWSNMERLIKKAHDPDVFEDTIFNEIRMCNNFPITLAYELFMAYKPQSVLDPSMGWGDRLIAATCANVFYTGFDPSQCLKNKYKSIIQVLGSSSKHKTYTKAFEDANLGKKMFDMVLTSPPFFDLELYETHPEQSIQRYKTENKWIREFLIPFIDKCIDHTQTNGIIIIYIPEYKEFIQHMQSKNNIVYDRTITFLTPKRRNMLVYRKINHL